MPPRSSDRSINTCRSCRRRKIRCDRSRPRCNRCRETGAVCLYEDQVPQPPPSYQFVAETPGEPTESQRRSNNGPDPTSGVSISPGRLQTIESRVEALGNMIKALQAQSSSGVTSSAARSTTDVSSASIHEPDAAFSIPGHLSRQGGGRMRYVEQTFWASLCKEASDLDDLLTSQARYLLQTSTEESDDEAVFDSEFEEDNSAMRRHEAATRRSANAGRSKRPSESSHQRLLGDIVQSPPAWQSRDQVTTRTVARNPDFMRQMPSKRRCDALLEGYIKGYHPMVPLIHVSTFRHRYEEFWRTREDPNAGATASMAFAAVLVAILYAGSVACPEAVSSGAVGAPDPEQAATHLHKLAMRALRLSNFPRTPTLDSFRAYLICQSTWMREEEPLTCVAFVGLALRVATMLGLHRDPTHFSGMDAIECEVRRRVWWQLVHVDVLVAIASGLPPMVDLNTWDVQSISELREEYFGSQVGMEYTEAVRVGQRPHDFVADPRDPANKSMVSSVGILVAGKLRATLVLRRTLACLFNRGPLTTSELVAMRSEFRLLGEDLTARIARIPEPDPRDVGLVAANASFENNFALNRWARLLLSAYVDEKYCIACHPVLRAPVSEIWPDLYPQAVEHCRAFLTKCAQMASVPDFSHFQWSWPGNHQPLHAIMVLLVDLNQTPESESAAASRKAIDIAFALCGPNGGIVGGDATAGLRAKRPLTEGGQEAWEYFRRLRNKAWQKAGLDPDIVWTREQAIQYCNQQAEPEVLTTETGPMWNQATPVTMEAFENLTMQVGASEFELRGMVQSAASPANIDWTYLDEVLEGSQQHMGLGFDYDTDDPRAGM